MAVKLHRCRFTMFKVGAHPCHRVQSALDEQGIEYEVIKAPTPKGKRTRVGELTSQRQLPVIEFEDGSAYRAESKDMAAEIRAGRLSEHAETSAGDAEAPAR